MAKKPLRAGRIKNAEPKKLRVPVSGARRYILTSAQNNTDLHQDVWYNLLAMAEHYRATVLVSRTTYNKANFGKKAVKPGTKQASDADELWYDPAIGPYVSDHRVQLAPGLVWCGELNILPTAEDPLSGLESYSGRNSAVFPHAKFAMASVASAKNEATKLIFTTGTVTRRNYLKKKAGLKAEPKHGYGGTLVEVTPDGSWYVRQLQAKEDGSIQDLDVVAAFGEVTTGNPVAGLVWGDVHQRCLDTEVERLAWGKGGMLDVLKPRYQVIHDLIDFRARNHHDAKDPHRAFQKHVRGEESVMAELSDAAGFLAHVQRSGCETIVVDSNHDRALGRWLRDSDYKADPVNALFYLRASVAVYEAIADGRSESFHLLEWAIRHVRPVAPPAALFLHPDQSWVREGIEHGMHGDLGINGARGGIKQFARMGRPANVAHSHSAGIYLGVFQAGTSSRLDLGYNSGPSSWSHSHIIVYPGGTRTICTMWKGRWRA